LDPDLKPVKITIKTINGHFANSLLPDVFFCGTFQFFSSYSVRGANKIGKEDRIPFKLLPYHCTVSLELIKYSRSNTASLKDLFAATTRMVGTGGSPYCRTQCSPSTLPGTSSIAGARSASFLPIEPVYIRVADPHHFNADPGPDPSFHFNVDPDPRVLILIKMTRICDQ
jgi:hypothetical protein